MKKILLATTFMVASVAAFSNAEAASFGKTAAVVILPTPIDLSTEVQQLDFATIQKPDGVDVFSEILATSTTGQTAGSTATVVSGQGQPGIYTVKGDANNQISMSVTLGTVVPGLTLSDFSMDYDGNSYTAGATAAPTATGKDLKIGSRLTIASSVVSGTHAPGYNIEVVYQ